MSVFCAVAAARPPLVAVWLAYTLFAYVALTGTAALAFRWLYCRPTYETWRRKTNPRYPDVATVAREIVLGGLAGPPVVALAPAVHLWAVGRGYLDHCGAAGTGEAAAAFLPSLVVCLVATDLYEWAWHQLGHRVAALWVVHRHHHQFPNPTPFATIADQPPDNVMRSLYPLVACVVCGWVLGAPPDMDALYGAVGLVNVLWGTYLHSGHEYDVAPYDHPWLNTSFQHHVHHAVSSASTPYHTGFLLRAWDRMAGTQYCGTAVVPAEVARRTRAEWERVVVPDYRVLLDRRWWWRSAAAGRRRSRVD